MAKWYLGALAAALALVGGSSARAFEFLDLNLFGSESCSDCNSCGNGPCGGYEAGFDLCMLDLYCNHGVGEANGGNAYFDDNAPVIASARIWAGYRNSEGMGVRGRFFWYESAFPDPDAFFNTHLYDIEFMSSISICDWWFDGFVGLRWGDVSYSDEDNNPSGYRFDGAGPTIGVDVRRPLFGNFSFVGGVRLSALYGDTQEVINDDMALGTAVYITEFNVGVDYCRPMGNGAMMCFRAAWENQLYSSLSANVDNDIDPEDIDVTLAGPVFSISIVR